jgi:hypothetical protein
LKCRIVDSLAIAISLPQSICRLSVACDVYGVNDGFEREVLEGDAGWIGPVASTGRSSLP